MQEGQGDAGEIAAAAGRPHDDIGILAGDFHLRQRFLPDDRLVHQNMIQHAAQRILVLAPAGRRHFDRFADGDAQRAGSCPDRPPGLYARHWWNRSGWR